MTQREGRLITRMSNVDIVRDEDTLMPHLRATVYIPMELTELTIDKKVSIDPKQFYDEFMDLLKSIIR